MSSSSEPTSAWLVRVSSIQRERMTPEQQSDFRRRAESSRKMALMAKRAERVHKSVQLSSSAWSAGMQSEELREGGHAAQSRSLSARVSMQAFSAPTFMQAAAERKATIEEEEEAEAVLEQEMNRLVQDQVENGTLDAGDANAAMSGGAQDELAAKLQEALTQLVEEPTDSMACAAKFELYEEFAKLTELARDKMIDVWEAAKDDFAQAPATAARIEQDVKAIDHHDNLGIHDDPHKWFVHGMCKKACLNQAQITKVLASVATKLSLLAQFDECPICLEKFSDNCKSTVLSCAHKVCEDCWTHWSAVCSGRAPVCPVCRQTEFLEVILQATPTARVE